MRQTKVGNRFAKSILDLAVETNVLDQVRADMSLILSTCEKSKDLRVLLASPVVNSTKKLTILNRIFGGKIGELSLKFVELITKKGREKALMDIAYAFEQLYLKHMNILKAEILSVDGISEEVRNKVKSIVRETFAKEVILEEKVDPELIGGIVLTVGDKQVDASIKAQLDKLRRGFDRNLFVSEL